MEKRKDPKVECPECTSVVFDNVNSVVLRSIQSEDTDKGVIYRDKLVRCAGCGASLCIARDELELIEVGPDWKRKGKDGDKSSS